MRFRKSIKLAPGIRMNLSGSGVGWTLGPRGASVGIGSRGTFFNAGIPGTGLSHRQLLAGPSRTASTRSAFAGSPSTPPMQRISLAVSVEDDGTVIFKDVNGLPASAELVATALTQKSSAIRDLLQQACDRINDQVDAVTTLHQLTPDPRTPPHFQAQVFQESEPVRPIRRQLGFFAKFFRSNVARVEAEYVREMANFDSAMTEREARKAEFEQAEEKRRVLFLDFQRGSPGAVDQFFSAALQDISWPRETHISYDLSENGRSMRLDVDLPEIEDMPQETATVPQRGYKLSIKDLGPVQLRKMYAQHIHSIAFRLIGEVFAVLPGVSEVVLSGYSQRPDAATAQVKDEYLLSVKVQRLAWEEIDFARLGDVGVIESLARFELVRSMTKSGVFKPIEPIGHTL